MFKFLIWERPKDLNYGWKIYIENRHVAFIFNKEKLEWEKYYV